MLGYRRGVLFVLTLVVGACSSAPVATITMEQLPPAERDDLADIFDPILEPIGYRITRASLIDRTTYQVDPSGTHLALYVAPIDDIAPDRFAADFAQLVPSLLPLVFDRWPRLDSFDLCQEPYSSILDTPPSLTIIDLTRAAAADVAWDQLGLDEIIALDVRDDISVWARAVVKDSPTWQAAAEE